MRGGRILSKVVSKCNISDISQHDQHFFDICQVDTPHYIIKKLWNMIHELYGDEFETVLDLGAGDGRFSLYGNYKSYCGVEIDSNRLSQSSSKKIHFLNSCAFDFPHKNFHLCIGNPPYVRYHKMDDDWLDFIHSDISKKIDKKIDKKANAYLYFLVQALLKTKDDGLVVQIIPYEWVSRPSAKKIREYIKDNNWTVSVYRFTDKIFSRVLTTASITIIDKKNKSGAWNYFEIDKNFKSKKTKILTGKKELLSYNKRIDDLYAQRGLSPGTQKIFCLTEGERLHHGLHISRDVVPCLTSLKTIPKDVTTIDKKIFKKYFIDMGARCWLIKTYKTPTKRLNSYLSTVDIKSRSTWTCMNRDIWWKLNEPRVPELIYSAGFTKFGPKIVENKIDAIAVGGAHGIFNKTDLDTKILTKKLKNFDFESHLVGHAGVLKKIEVNQMNSVLQAILQEEKNNE